MQPLVLGLDIGGTATRALVTTLDGARVGYGRAGAGNPVTGPREQALANIRAAVDAAMSNVDSKDIRAAVIGAAGSAHLQTLKIPWGVPVEARIVGDVVVAFAAGTSADRGTVLIAGTGAVAAQIEADQMTRVADGLGWLLGDLGSGFWLGREAARHTARALQAGHLSSLAKLVAEAVGETEPDPFVVALHHRPPRDLAGLAPLVTAAAAEGDPAATAIVREAGTLLAATVAEIRDPGDISPIVLSGGVLLQSAQLRDSVHTALKNQWPTCDVLLAEAGEVGAARLAARSVSREP